MATRNPCTYLPRRLQIVFSLTLFIVICIVFFTTSSSYDLPYADRAAEYIPKQIPKVSPPGWMNPFRQSAHAPPVQANSSSGDAAWFSDWKWQNPFSSSITLDENRAVLPPLKQRTPVYTYYDSDSKKDEATKRAEHELLVIWRRAWWAQGFRPVVLGRPEAINNPLYRGMQNLALEVELEHDLLRWLAWGNMGTGILANWLALPMAPHADPLLGHLRRGDFPQLTRFEGLGSGLFLGEKDAINKAIDVALHAQQSVKATALIELVPADVFKVDPQHDAIAFYSTTAIFDKYKALAELLKGAATRAEGLAQLPQLINSHLHMTWQNTFTSGIAVLKPLPDHTSNLVFPAVELARNLSQCTDSPSPASCPPNLARCKPCMSSHPMLITMPPVFRNSSSVFTIGTIPHPYTLASLSHQTSTLTAKYIRRKTKRDNWILAATKELLGTGISSYARLVDMKDAVASDYGSSRNLWLTAERVHDAAWHDDLAWTLGFPVPQAPPANGRSETPVPGPERRPPPPKQEEGKVPPQKELNKEIVLLESCRAALRRGGAAAATTALRDVVEAWNLADTELWRFARAFAARRRVERIKWEEEEREFAGSEGKGSWGRWFDRREDLD